MGGEYSGGNYDYVRSAKAGNGAALGAAGSAAAKGQGVREVPIRDDFAVALPVESLVGNPERAIGPGEIAGKCPLLASL
jgi:hypothetical protein